MPHTDTLAINPLLCIPSYLAQITVKNYLIKTSGDASTWDLQQLFWASTWLYNAAAVTINHSYSALCVCFQHCN